jgi:hypothetical protein
LLKRTKKSLKREQNKQKIPQNIFFAEIVNLNTIIKIIKYKKEKIIYKQFTKVFATGNKIDAGKGNIPAN